MPIDSPQVFIPDLLRSHARYRPQHEALVCGSQRLTWAEFGQSIDRVARRLQALGVGRGCQIAVLMNNRVELLTAIFGIVSSGACVVPLSGLLTAEQSLGLIRDSDAVGLMVSQEYAEKLLSTSNADDTTNAQNKLSLHCPALRDELLVVVTGNNFAASTQPLNGVQASDPLKSCYEPFIAWTDWLSQGHQDPVLTRTYEASDPFNIIYSSGTTGLPKGIVQSHAARLHWAWSNSLEMGFSQASRVLTTTALYSNGTWLMMLPALFCGASLIAMQQFDPIAFQSIVKSERITHSFMVPTQYLMLLEHPAFDPGAFDTIEVLLCAGSPLRRDVKQRVIEKLGNRLIELYGFSEGFATMLKPARQHDKFDTVGTPVIGFELAIVSEDGHELPAGQIGEIAGYGGGMMQAYHKQAAASEKLIWRDSRGRSFIRSGDIGVVDDEGFLRLVDRKKDMIISGGFNVFPSDIEPIVAQHPHVFDVAVIGVEHARWGEAAFALVIPREGESVDAEAIRQWANARLAKPQQLVGVEFRKEFPRNALGKVLKRLLRDAKGSP